MNSSQIHRGRFTRIQELAMEFSPDEDIRTVLAKSVTEAQPKRDSTALSRRAELRVRPNTVYRCFFSHQLNPGSDQAESEASEIEGKAE